MDVSEYIEYVASEGEIFANVAEAGALDVDVPTCPGWDMRELVRHLGFIHLWAAGHVAYPHGESDFTIDMNELLKYWPDLAGDWVADDQLISWYRDTHANLVRALKEAPADVESFTFLVCESPLHMWARRQASEIAMHRFDAENARGITSNFDPLFAADVLDELLSSFAARRRDLDIANDLVLHVHTDDTNEDWYMTIGSEEIVTSRSGGNADLTLSGTAAELYLLLWNRAPDTSVMMSGDTDIMDLWHNNIRVRWS